MNNSKPKSSSLAKSYADQALTELHDALAKGKSDTLRKYLSAMAKFSDYSLSNCLLIASQRPDATYVAGFQRWKQLGRWVMKGEKGIVILAPLVRRKEASGEARRQAAGRDDEDSVFGFRAVRVFDIAQTDGEPLPEFSKIHGSPGDKLQKLKDQVRHRGIELGYETSLGGPEGASLGGKILLLEGLEPAEEFSVLAHELAHELLHRGARDSRPSRNVRELEAEAVAFVVCKAAGLECGEHAADYIHLYDGDTKQLQESLANIQRVALDISSKLEDAAGIERPQADAASSPAPDGRDSGLALAV